MKVEYKRNLRQSYLVVTSDQMIADYRIQMCTRNVICGLLQMESMVADGRLQFWYDITGKQSLEEYLRIHALEKELLLKLFLAVYAVTEEVHKYMLEEACIWLNIGQIFVGNGGKQIYFCYYPEELSTMADSFRLLMEELLTRVEHNDKELVAAAYEAYQRSLQPGCSMKEICELIQKNDAGKETEMVLPTTADLSADAEPMYVEDITQEYGACEKRSFSVKRMKEQMRKLVNSVETGWKGKEERKHLTERQIMYEPTDAVEEIESGTVFLGEDVRKTKQIAVLEYRGISKERNLVIEETPYLIGSREDASGRIAADGISRIHARITQEDEIYYIEDLNSKNGTWVDERLLNYQEKVLLSEGMRIRFASEEYIFNFVSV